jgi:hypothetical protein
MRAKDKNPFESYDYRKTEEYKRHRRVLEEVRNMSQEEKLQTLIDVGIVNEDGELTKRYGGDAPNPED